MHKTSPTWTALVIFTGLAFAASGTEPAAGQTAGQSAGQKSASSKAAAAAPRLPDGKPDLQGFWDFRTLTPLERPQNLGNKAVLTEEEARTIQQQNAERRAKAAAPSDVNAAPRKPGGGGAAVGGYNDFWIDVGENVVGDRRTSLIIDPPDGRIPARNPAAPYQVGSLLEDLELSRPIRLLTAGGRANGPEDRGLAERCLIGFNSGPPMLPSGYNNHMQLVQNSDTVAILNEMNHDTRIIPLDGRPQVSSALRQWAGVSRGHWDGDTLVVKTTNFTDKTASFVSGTLFAYGVGTTLNLTERFRRVSDKVLLYEFTVEDPATFTRPFTASVPMVKSDEPVYEYACHEGNYGLLSILRGARAEERGK
jgi:hypothetical protein